MTGTTSGVGKELTRILYSKNGKVYTAARSPDRAHKVNSDIKARYPESKGGLIYLNMDLEDLDTVKAAAKEFLSKESRLDVLWNNAGVLLTPAPGSTTKQGWDLQLGVNCLAPFLFTKLLTPILRDTAKSSASGSTRVVFVASSATYLFAPIGGVEIAKLDKSQQNDPLYMYGVSKAGVALYALQIAQMHKKDGVVAVVRLRCLIRLVSLPVTDKPRFNRAAIRAT